MESAVDFHVEAQLRLANILAAGMGVPKDLKEAAFWWEQAALGGSADAQFKIGVAYKAGVGVREDRVEAYKWLRLAAPRNQQARELRDQHEKTLSREQIDEAMRRVKTFKPVPSE